jgi:UDP-N-acetyl-D-galactosamine dehydrogenase
MAEPADLRLAVVGLGYVGLPLAVAFGKTLSVVGFDISHQRIAELQSGYDDTLEVSREDLADSRQLTFTEDPSALHGRNVFIITVPTPLDQGNRPDLSALREASETVGRALTGGVVIYESTVYPGAIEEECVPILEKVSGLKVNADFSVGYSPERVNPGDKSHRLTTIKKVVSGSTAATVDFLRDLYGRVVEAGTHPVSSIKVAEAAKIIENIQRDINIALVNELAILFNRLAIDTEEVLQAAGTKWNFMPFRPGLVGGHCVSVAPHYLAHKAIAAGIQPDVILAGRRPNDHMGSYAAARLIEHMRAKDIPVAGGRALVMGFTFKENCVDVRGSRAIDLVNALVYEGMLVDVYDPRATPGTIERHFGLAPQKSLSNGIYDAIVVTVPHDDFAVIGAAAIRGFGKPKHVLYDLKSLFPASQSDLRL